MRSATSTPRPPMSGRHIVPGVRLRDVSAAYDGARVLHGISIEVGAAAITVVTGANGAGKSTLLAVVAGLHRPTAGDVEGIDGRSIAYVPQRSAVPEHFPVTVRDVASMGRWPTLRRRWGRLAAGDRRIVDESLTRLDVLHLAGRSFGELSGGQRQRVLVAQALAREADLLLLDEPTVGLDRAAGSAIRAVLRAEADRGVTVVEVTHDPVAVAEADARVHLEAGCLVPAPR
jgi:zinc/manganese transport system ATP-binding protein